jgi:hypothetical protein
MPSPKIELIDDLMKDVIGEDDIQVSKDEITETIANILNQYGLSTDMSFVEKMATMKFHNNKGEEVQLEELPSELKDAAFLPVNTIADIALRQDLDMMVSQIPEWYVALQVTRDAICEADIVKGTLSRTIDFDRTNLDDSEESNIISKIEEVEDRMELHQIIKNHVVFNTLLYGESYVYCIPYAKVFSDLYKFRLNKADKKNSSSVANMFETSSVLNGYGYSESAVEKNLNSCSHVNDSTSQKKGKKNRPLLDGCWITESEIMEINPMYHAEVINSDGTKNKAITDEMDREYEETMKYIGDNISYIEEDIALPVIEQSAHDLKAVYEAKYQEQHSSYVNEVNTFFEQVMMEADDKNDIMKPMNDGEPSTFDKHFSRIKGCYERILPATKLIPIRIDRTIIGYYYISDQTRPEKAGERRNSGLSGYTLRTPSIGYDTFSPDQMFCEKLANKIINNFDLKFMRDNTALHSQIVSILQSHKFNEAMMRFIFIPAEHVCCFAINKDGDGRGHSMLEPGLISARMYMFLKLYSLLYQINNSQVRVYQLRMSGIDKNYKQFVQETMRKFAARRVTANDVFNYRSSMTKVSGGSELIMPMGTNNEAPITVESIPAAEAPINNDLLEAMKSEAVNSTPVPALLLTNGGVSEIEFAKETELANTKFESFISSCKIDFNRDTTKLYRRLNRWETDIDPTILQSLKFVFRMPTAKQLNVTSDKINNFNALFELASQTFLTPQELKGEKDEDEGNSKVAREFKKLMIAEYLGEIDVDRFEELANMARDEANRHQLEHAENNKNILDESTPEAGGGEEMF